MDLSSPEGLGPAGASAVGWVQISWRSGEPLWPPADVGIKLGQETEGEGNPMDCPGLAAGLGLMTAQRARGQNSLLQRGPGNRDKGETVGSS